LNATLSGSIAALRQAGSLLSEAAAGVAAADPGPRAFGADHPGRLGELGRALHQHWQRALDTRAREAAAHGARLDEAADLLARVVVGYADIDESARRAHPEVQ
jgi:hypothetical protein